MCVPARCVVGTIDPRQQAIGFIYLFIYLFIVWLIVCLVVCFLACLPAVGGGFLLFCVLFVFVNIFLTPIYLLKVNESLSRPTSSSFSSFIIISSSSSIVVVVVV